MLQRGKSCVLETAAPIAAKAAIEAKATKGVLVAIFGGEKVFVILPDHQTDPVLGAQARDAAGFIIRRTYLAEEHTYRGVALEYGRYARTEHRLLA